MSHEVADGVIRLDPRDLSGALERWTDDRELEELVAVFDGPRFRDLPLAERLDRLADFGDAWNFRGGKERNLVADTDFSDHVEALTASVSRRLGLRDTAPPPARRVDHLVILGGLLRACLARPLYAARLVTNGGLQVGSVIALGGHRVLAGDELPMAATFLPGAEVEDEFDAMDAGVRAAFGLGAPTFSDGRPSEVVGEAWSVREYDGDGMSVAVVAAPSSAPGKRRANTPDTYAWLADSGRIAEGDSVLIVTTDIYKPYQYADALRMLALPYGLDVDAAGMSPGEVEERLAQPFATHSYLQELRSTFFAFRNLHDAISV